MQPAHPLHNLRGELVEHSDSPSPTRALEAARLLAYVHAL
eukprot:COSAG02_NODE_54867_length_293_cov_1.680412_1_plen_39_part_10